MSTRDYVKKPIVVRAVQYNGRNHQEIQECYASIQFFDSPEDDAIHIKTLEGFIEACPGDYIIEGIKGEHYPCKPDIFEATYEEVNNAN